MKTRIIGLVIFGVTVYCAAVFAQINPITQKVQKDASGVDPKIVQVKQTTVENVVAVKNAAEQRNDFTDVVLNIIAKQYDNRVGAFIVCADNGGHNAYSTLVVNKYEPVPGTDYLMVGITYKSSGYYLNLDDLSVRYKTTQGMGPVYQVGSEKWFTAIDTMISQAQQALTITAQQGDRENAKKISKTVLFLNSIKAVAARAKQ
jgi:hypothetical protein